MHILFPFVVYTRDDLCRNLETILVEGAEGLDFRKSNGIIYTTEKQLSVKVVTDINDYFVP
jgi:hypothetical protein